jgi:hypothetical protein
MIERVMCVKRGDAHKHSDCRSITKIRTDEWKEYTREEAHEKVKAAPGSLQVQAGGKTVPLLPAEHEGIKYVRTLPDDTADDNLLKVETC